MIKEFDVPQVLRRLGRARVSLVEAFESLVPSRESWHVEITVLLISVGAVHLQEVVFLALLLRQGGIYIPLCQLLLLV